MPPNYNTLWTVVGIAIIVYIVLAIVGLIPLIPLR